MTTVINSNSSNGVMSPASSTAAAQSPAELKTYFKTPEGRYKLQYEKTHPSSLLHYAHGKTVTQHIVGLDDWPGGYDQQQLDYWGEAMEVEHLVLLESIVSKSNGGTTRIVSMGASTSSSSMANPNFDGKGTYLIFNVGDAIFISDLNSQDKDPIKSIHFSNSNPVCHAFDQDAKDGHDLLIGLSSGDVYSVSLRQQLQDVGKRLVGAQHYNKDGYVNNRQDSVPNKDGAGDSSFPVVKDQSQFSVAHARYSKSNPISRWHICQASINSTSFSSDGAYLATVGRDGYLRVFDYTKELLICGGKSYYGALLCCAWSMDGKYILMGGEDDLVQVWSMEDHRVVAWGEGHNSWVSGVAFDSYWSSPNASDNGETIIYRFGSVGQDSQLLLWDLEMDEIVVPLRRPPGGSPTYSTGSQSSHWDSADPLESVLTACWEGHIKVWVRPVVAESQSSNSQTLLATSLKEKPTLSNKISNSSYK
ncbi:hypothetical protein TanjilG_18733 [Lupinus angustifolius]|uniref:Uncharacterized protein n=1 Tax=Lupinus angustifolius TaxID=3871 RepID=A0A1J7GCR3_LUPAN|nr:hypothetical protein TanjilG_18733 [Lupinus angustifolius]